MWTELIHPTIGVILLIFILVRLSGYISAHLQGLAYLLTRSQSVAVLFMFLVLAPGVFIHELSHWLMARLLGVPTKGFRVWPKRTRSRIIQMGAVEVRGGGTISLALIGMAPFLLGTIVLILLGGWFQGPPHHIADWRTWFSREGWTPVLAFFHRPDWPWRFYAIWIISTSMMPSAADRAPLRPLGWLLLIGSVGLILAGVAGTLLQQIQGPLLRLLDLLAAAFWLAVIGNLAVAGGLWLTEFALSTLLGTRVEYG
ncbi:MAG: hypothetical protein GXO55_07775 [Chloroflexi bacterium]|nr:hypothetical protein [Chloroflexota bacterium]